MTLVHTLMCIEFVMYSKKTMLFVLGKPYSRIIQIITDYLVCVSHSNRDSEQDIVIAIMERPSWSLQQREGNSSNL